MGQRAQPIRTLSTKWIGMRDVKCVVRKTSCLARASGALGQAGDGGDQDRAEHKAHHGKASGKAIEYEPLRPRETLALGMIEELLTFPVDLNHGQQPRQAGEEAPKFSSILAVCRRHRAPKYDGADC
jgi:hypothetical protein